MPDLSEVPVLPEISDSSEMETRDQMMAEQMSVARTFTARIEKTAAAGRYVGRQNTFEYTLGYMAETIEMVRESNRAIFKALQEDETKPDAEKMKPTVRHELLRSLSRGTLMLTGAAAKLMTAEEKNGAKHRDSRKPKRVSFVPGAKITDVEFQEAKTP
jgi:hypothetical protein